MPSVKSPISTSVRTPVEGNCSSPGRQILCIALAIASVLLGLYLLNRHTTIFERFSDNAAESGKKCKVMLFYAQWCGHCQSLKPKWDSAKTRFDTTKVEVEEVNADDASSKDLFEKHNVSGFPSIKIVKKDGTVVDYQGDRSEEDLVQFVLSNTQ